VADKDVACYFEDTVRDRSGKISPKTIANWITGDVARLLNASGTEISRLKVSPARLVEMLELNENGVISGKIAKAVFEEMFQTGRTAGEVVDAKGLTQISDEAQLETAADRAISANPQAVADYRAGKQQALAFLVGQIMKETRGRANPAMVNQFLKEKLR
ncbi:MAG: Asp-tRNA(Asn)/Glu-tRNA(Gln) amidotransferase GatCAB subunit B, partial [Dehalococcoidia bacterium]|nr:Asp-tRNA(Asn)/Glu-tRNA(Gln) amidotransferase GatCAB subunit B [Dehalococcoidia bacterium]